MSNELVKDKDVRALLDRRAELKEQINKMMTEYTAIGNILTRLHRLEEEKENPPDYSYNR